MIDTDGDTVPQIEYYTEGGVPRAFIGEDSKVSLVVRLNDTSSTNVDTLIRVDMQPTGELVNYVKPYAHEVVDSWRTFYRQRHRAGREGVSQRAKTPYCMQHAAHANPPYRPSRTRTAAPPRSPRRVAMPYRVTFRSAIQVAVHTRRRKFD